MVFRRRPGGPKPPVIDASNLPPPPDKGDAAPGSDKPREEHHDKDYQSQGRRRKRPEVMVQDFTQDPPPQPNMAKAETLVEFVHVVNRLKKKVGDGGFDPVCFLRAQEAVKNLAAAYLDIAAREIRELSNTIQMARMHPEKYAEYNASIYKQAHDVKSGGGSYGFPLISRIAESLCWLTEGMGPPGELDFSLMKFHIDALIIVVRKKIKGHGGEVGMLLAEGLEVVVAKRKAHDPSLVLGEITKFLEKLDSA